MKFGRAISVILTIVLLLACNSRNQFNNKEYYEITRGDTLEIYFSNNSCCYYCLANKETLNHISFINIKTIKEVSKNCDGCNSQSAFIFKAISSGTDTIFLKSPTVMLPCDSSKQIERYIVLVK